MEDNSWNSNPIITGLIKEENKTYEREAIKDGIAKDKVSGLGKKKKRICAWQIEKAHYVKGKINVEIHIWTYLGENPNGRKKCPYSHISRKNS